MRGISISRSLRFKRKARIISVLALFVVTILMSKMIVTKNPQTTHAVTVIESDAIIGLNGFVYNTGNGSENINWALTQHSGGGPKDLVITNGAKVKMFAKSSKNTTYKDPPLNNDIPLHFGNVTVQNGSTLILSGPIIFNNLTVDNSTVTSLPITYDMYTTDCVDVNTNSILDATFWGCVDFTDARSVDNRIYELDAQYNPTPEFPYFIGAMYVPFGRKRIEMTVLDKLTLTNSAKIDVSGKGYPGGWGTEIGGNRWFADNINGYGMGGGSGINIKASNAGGAGGTHGGVGGQGKNGRSDKEGGRPKPIQTLYGTVFLDTANRSNTEYKKQFLYPGSGGGGGLDRNYDKLGTGGAGGGTIVIDTQILDLSGNSVIAANGGPGGRPGKSDEGGGGAGGTIWLRAKTIIRNSSGSVVGPTVTGGTGTATNRNAQVGIIRVNQYTDSHRMLESSSYLSRLYGISADGASASETAGAGGGGVVLIETDQFEESCTIVDSGQDYIPASCEEKDVVISGTTVDAAKISIKKEGGAYVQCANYYDSSCTTLRRFNSLTIGSGGVLTHNTTNSALDVLWKQVNFEIFKEFKILSGGKIDVSEKGFQRTGGVVKIVAQNGLISLQSGAEILANSTVQHGGSVHLEASWFELPYDDHELIKYYMVNQFGWIADNTRLGSLALIGSYYPTISTHALPIRAVGTGGGKVSLIKVPPTTVLIRKQITLRHRDLTGDSAPHVLNDANDDDVKYFCLNLMSMPDGTTNKNAYCNDTANSGNILTKFTEYMASQNPYGLRKGDRIKIDLTFENLTQNNNVTITDEPPTLFGQSGVNMKCWPDINSFNPFEGKLIDLASSPIKAIWQNIPMGSTSKKDVSYECELRESNPF